MPSRDYLIRQIEEMGVFLAMLLRKVLKLKEENQQEQMETAVTEALKQKLGLDIDELVVLENEDFFGIISRHFTSEDQLDKLAGILKLMGENIEHSFTLTRANYLRKALFIYLNIQEKSTTFSYERKIKIGELQELIFRSGLDES